MFWGADNHAQHLETLTDVIIVFELMEGGDLYKYLCKQPEHRVSEEDARHIMHQVLAGVAHAHNQRICHRDLKLENILLKDDTLDVVKIADFGLSDFYRPGSTLRTSCGSLSYLAPEVFKSVPSAGPPIDVWGLGVILFALLCGRLPFEGPDLIGTKRPREVSLCHATAKCG
jgi:serine/threonine protein kinase